MSDDEEYEVESIVGARLAGGKKAKRIWTYRVRWKGYPPEEDSWIPADSFVTTEMVPAFWERARTDDRDWRDTLLFKVGEEIYRVGPPRGKSRKSLNADVDAPVQSAPPAPESSNRQETSISSGKRKRKAKDANQAPDHPAKRRETKKSQPAESSTRPVVEGLTTRAKASALSISARILAKKESPEIIPDSDEDGQSLQLPSVHVSPTRPTTRSRTGVITPAQQKTEILILDDDEDEDEPTRSDNAPHSSDDMPVDTLPTHRARLANPRVQRVSEKHFGNMDGGISSKVRAVEGEAVASSSSNINAASGNKSKNVKPGPGRSSVPFVSLLTAYNEGGLQTVKMRSNQSGPTRSSGSLPRMNARDHEILSDEDDPNLDAIPPTGRELLQLAGLDPEDADDLPDFEDTPTDDANQIAKGHADMSVAVDPLSSHRESLDKAKNNLFPVQTPSSPSLLPSSWNPSTIFGPLSLGASTPEDSKISVDAPQLLLYLDASVSIPTLVSQSHPTDDIFVQKIQHNGVPGKFYIGNAANAILSTIRATGECAKLLLSKDASGEQGRDFALLHNRLKGGDIFAAATGMSTLVLTSSSNPLSTRLNIPAALLHQTDQVLVSQVSIENWNGYASAAAGADDRRWSQYLVDEKII